LFVNFLRGKRRILIKRASSNQRMAGGFTALYMLTTKNVRGGGKICRIGAGLRFGLQQATVIQWF